jgi:hypothetical protein
MLLTSTDARESDFDRRPISFFKSAAKVETKVGQTLPSAGSQPIVVGIFEVGQMPKVRQKGMVCLNFGYSGARVPVTSFDLPVVTATILQMAGKRDSRYFEQRLKRDFPKVYANWRAGRHASVRAAAVHAGLIKPPTRFDALKREWKAASPAERKQFADWLRSGGARASSSAKVPTITDARRILLPRVLAFLNDWTRRHKKRPGQIMKQMGFSNFDARLGEAINSRRPLAEEVVMKLRSWLAKEGYR